MDRTAAFLIMDQAIIQLKDVSLVHNLGQSNEMTALKNINLEVYSGEYLVVFGPSGCGKSTLLYSMSGMEVPTKGEVVVAKQEFKTMSQDQFVSIRRSWMGTIFQAYNLIPSLNVLDNVILPQTFAGYSQGIRKRKATDLLEKMHIVHLAKRYPSQLSGGQQQRVAIARALIFNPPILLADEPVGNLDSESAALVMNLLAELNEKGQKTIILVTHEPYHLQYAHRIIYMKDGKIVREVRNTQKKQIMPGGEETATLNILSRDFPYLSPNELQIKVLVQHLLHQFTPEEVVRIEEGIAKRLKGELNAEGLRSYFDKSLEEGGVGLYKQRAEEFVVHFEEILAKSKLVDVKNEDKGDTFDERSRQAQEIRKYLLSAYKGNFNSLHIQRLERFIRLRLEQKIDQERFVKYLNISTRMGGAGLEKRTIRNLSRKLELLLVKYS